MTRGKTPERTKDSFCKSMQMHAKAPKEKKKEKEIEKKKKTKKEIKKKLF